MTTYPFELITYNPRKIMEYLRFCRYLVFHPRGSQYLKQGVLKNSCRESKTKYYIPGSLRNLTTGPEDPRFVTLWVEFLILFASFYNNS